MRRAGPRAIGSAMEAWTRDAAPATTLARVQACWDTVAGAAIAEEATPVAERGGTLTVACRSAVWAAELELLAPDLLERLNAALETPEGRPLKAVRVRGGRAR